jgi:hypothetical protein
MAGTNALLAMLDRPPPTEDQLRPRTQARTHTQADADETPTSNTRGGDWVRDGPTDGSARTPSVLRATAFIPVQNNTSTRFAAMGGGGTHSPLALLFQPPPTVA